MPYTYYGIMAGTAITGVIRVDDGDTLDPAITASLLPDWEARPALATIYERHHLVSGVVVAIDPRPLLQAQAEQLSTLRAAREVVINNTFVWDGSVFDADLTARSRLAELKIDSLDPAYVPTAWRLADNSWRTLSAADVAGVWAALRLHTTAQFETFSEVETEVLNAATVPEVLAVDWPA